MVEKLSSVNLISLERVHRGYYYLTSEKLKGSRKCRKVKVIRTGGKSQGSREEQPLNMWWPWRWLWDANIMTWANVRCARAECDNAELTTKNATPRARSRVHVVLRVHSGSWFSRCHLCGTPQRPERWFYSSTAFYHANATPIAKFFPSGCCSPIVSCHRSVNLYTKFLHISHLENGSFEVLSLHSPSVTVDRRQL